ncbi:hypothetical protein [Vitiosangium sp. GDMCC 1.1324]|uniref:hypothetical protein n=1 Tax=Vitiosangium sp. (strain GDMCC 1.1324) TaxID=2138576 RepID=UPI000D3A3A54|nr:hypothetical protein [Vitiosangium sp. GDMCC 1.1324]PTL78776.1 hypothetical protein DAT35_37575 [Vitiosangium sp. GDMCC 1.1324]
MAVERVKVSGLDGGPITYGKTVQIEATVRATVADRLEFYITSTPESPSWTYTGLSFYISTVGSQVKTGTITLPWASNIAIRTVLRASSSGTVCSNDWFAFRFQDIGGLAPGSGSCRAPNPSRQLAWC